MKLSNMNSSSSKPTKRKLTQDAPISPPSLKRKIQSGTTSNAVASFFTPASQKPITTEVVTWQERAVDDDSTPKTLLVGKYTLSSNDTPTLSRSKVAAFDFDSTLIATASGKKFASDANDWKWWHTSVPTTLKKMYHDEGQVLSLQVSKLFTNRT